MWVWLCVVCGGVRLPTIVTSNSDVSSRLHKKQNKKSLHYIIIGSRSYM